MDSLKLIIETLSEEDKSSFKLFINRDKSLDSRKDLQLFEYLAKTVNPESSSTQATIYPKGNKSAYSALRRRLFNHLCEFVSLVNKAHLQQEHLYLQRLNNLAIHLFHQKEKTAAWKYLNKAVQVAEEQKLYMLLHDLYKTQINWSHTNSKIDLGLLIQKYKANQNLVDTYEKTLLSNALIRAKLSRLKTEGEASYLTSIIDLVLFTYKVKDKIESRPELFYMIAKATRESITSKKDFLSYEDFLCSKLEILEKNDAFHQHNHYYKLKLMEMKLDTIFRNKKFDEAALYAIKFKESIYEYDQNYHSKFYPSFLHFLALALSYTERISEALIHLKVDHKLEAKTDAAVKRLIAIMHFKEEAYHHSIKTIDDIGHSKDWLLKKFDDVWFINLEILKVLAIWENGEKERARKYILSLIREYKKELSIHKSIKDFLQLINKYMEKPERIQQSFFIKQIEKDLNNLTLLEDEVQAINYYSWFQSKIHQIPYKESLFKAVKNKLQKEEI